MKVSIYSTRHWLFAVIPLSLHWLATLHAILPPQPRIVNIFPLILLRQKAPARGERKGKALTQGPENRHKNPTGLVGAKSKMRFPSSGLHFSKPVLPVKDLLDPLPDYAIIISLVVKPKCLSA